MLLWGVRTLQKDKFSGNFSVTVAVGAISLHERILEINDGDMEIDHISLVRRVRVLERITLFF